MKVRFLRTVVGHGFRHVVGDVADLPSDVAKDFLNAGHAEVIPEAPKKRAKKATSKTAVKKQTR